MLEKHCIVCGGLIKNRRNKKFCGYECAGLYRQNYAICPICGKKFKKSPSDISTHTCGSAECKKAFRSFRTPPERILPAHEKIKTNPNTGHFETHHGAVEWHLMSPERKEYRFKNLVLWIEENEDLLPMSTRTGKKVSNRTFFREMQRLKSDNEKYTHSRDDYHGWRVIKDFGKEDGAGDD